MRTVLDYFLLIAVPAGAVAAAAGYAIVTLRTLYAMQGGAFQVQPAPAGHYRFRSDFGLVEIDGGAGKLRLIGPASSLSVPIAQLRGVELRVEEALLDRWHEFLIGMQLHDLFAAFRDRIRWQVVVAVLEDGREIPLYAAGQIHRRELLFDWLIRAELALAWRLRIAPEVPAVARGVCAEIASRFAASGSGSVPARTGAGPT